MSSDGTISIEFGKHGTGNKARWFSLYRFKCQMFDLIGKLESSTKALVDEIENLKSKYYILFIF